MTYFTIIDWLTLLLSSIEFLSTLLLTNFLTNVMIPKKSNAQRISTPV